MAIAVNDEFFILNDFEIVNRFFGLMTYNQSFLSVGPLNQCFTTNIKFESAD